jgi:hypothetical protein
MRSRERWSTAEKSCCHRNIDVKVGRQAVAALQLPEIEWTVTKHDLGNDAWHADVHLKPRPVAWALQTLAWTTELTTELR